jgi:Zn-dependent protease with chaperone function
MSSVLPLLLAVLAEALGEAGIGLGFEAPWAVPLLAALPHLLARRARRAALRGRFRASERWLRLVRMSGALAFAVAVVGLGWVTSVERWTAVRLGSHTWPELAVLLALAPFVALQALALHAEVCVQTAPGPHRRRVFQFQLRGFVLVLVPVLIYLGLVWLVGLHEVARAWITHVGLAQALFAAALIAVVALLLPFVLRRVWDTVPVPAGPARELLEVVAARARFRPAEWLVWRTGGALANAAVVGFTPWGRLVLFTDELLAVLGPRELVAVVGHEIGHARRRHVWILLSWALALVLGVDVAAGLLLDAWVGPDGDELGLTAALVLSVALLGLGALVFGWLSRRLELDADLFCAELTGDGAALASALRRVDGSWERGGWRHFSSARRVGFLAEALANPALAQRFKQKIVRLGVIGGLLASVAVASELRTLAGRLPIERIDTALALGRFEDAARLGAGLGPGALDDDEQAELALVLDVARASGDGADAERFVPELDDLLERTLGAPDGGALLPDAELGAALGRAFALAALASARGAPELEPLAHALRGARRADERWVELSVPELAGTPYERFGAALSAAAARSASHAE